MVSKHDRARSERGAGGGAGGVSLCVLAWLLASCAGRLPQVPESQPHGVVTIRVVHPDADMAYQDYVVLDDRRPVPVRRDVSVRLRPGVHLLTLLSDAEAYEVQLATVTHTIGHCIDPGCTRFAPRREDRYALVPQGGHSCSQTLQLPVAAGQKSLALLIAGQGPGCRACERAELSARSCP